VSTPARRPLVVGNWKLHNTRAESQALAAGVAEKSAGLANVDLAVAPVFTALDVVGTALAGSAVRLSAQDVYWESRGAFTGEVSAPLLRDAGCTYCIVGHSERRQFFGDSDDHVRRKAAAVLAAGMTPIVCVGESLAQREAGHTEALVLAQLAAALDGLSETQAAAVVVAYEPIWAIGTGRNASPADAQAVHVRIRGAVAQRFGGAVGAGLRILYGGSVKPDNARALLSEPDVDGALVGGASLDLASFVAIAGAAV
jgi:triosephosphate isomerase